jgi:carboxyl-terminal processing protease
MGGKIVRSDYVEKPDDAKLIEAAIKGMLAGLDPHSRYLDARGFRDVQSWTGDASTSLSVLCRMLPTSRWER